MKLSEIYKRTNHQYNENLTDKDRLINYIEAQISLLDNIDSWEYCDVTNDRKYEKYLRRELAKLIKELIMVKRS